MTILKDYSRDVGTEPVEAMPSLWPMAHPGTAETTGALVHLAIHNVGTVPIWLSRVGDATVGQPGSYPLAPGEREEHHAEAIPKERLSGVAEGPGGALTVTLRHHPRVFTTAAQAATMLPGGTE